MLCTRQQHIQPLGFLQEADLPAVVAPDQTAYDDVRLFALVIVDGSNAHRPRIPSVFHIREADLTVCAARLLQVAHVLVVYDDAELHGLLQHLLDQEQLAQVRRQDYDLVGLVVLPQKVARDVGHDLGLVLIGFGLMHLFPVVELGLGHAVVQEHHVALYTPDIRPVQHGSMIAQSGVRRLDQLRNLRPHAVLHQQCGVLAAR
mmetsp:Transcript_104470/g.304958  ORF Transcript_104470/g.304958 Transcript_104470/m.304958 type:complete len:203 (+) Transcript_104470:187-795(+)